MISVFPDRAPKKAANGKEKDVLLSAFRPGPETKANGLAGIAQLVEQRIRNQDTDAMMQGNRGKHGKAFGPPAVRWQGSTDTV